MSGSDRCLHCWQPREAVRRERLACVKMTGYETPEADFEWPSHRWKPWTDDELHRMGIRADAYEGHRLALEEDVMYWAACEDTLRGHVWATEKDAEWDLKVGQCWQCGTMRKEEEVTVP